MPDHSFSKAERLSGKADISTLRESSGFIATPFKIQYRIISRPGEPIARLIVSVPKAKFKKATDRNALKRKIRESYRLNKSILWEVLVKEGKQMHLFFVYRGNDILPFHEINRKLVLILQRLTRIASPFSGETKKI